jgi:UDP-N-acetylglucosamine transferase subunit ALG13
LILCVFGTHSQPFDRALDAVLQAAPEERIVVQHGATPPRPGIERAQWHRLLGYHELRDLMRHADVLVCHAGAGTLMTAIAAGRVPIAIPRLRSQGEHVDDHQVQITAQLGATGHVIPCLDRADLGDLIANARTARALPRTPSGDLHRAAISAAGGGRSLSVAG